MTKEARILEIQTRRFAALEFHLPLGFPNSVVIPILSFYSVSLSGHEHKYDDVRGKGFFGQTRRERRAYPEVDL